MKTCKDFVAIALLALGSLSGCNNTSALIGEWTEPVPGMENMIQGFKLEEGGKASSINMATLKYKTWEQQGDLLILTGESIGNGQTISFSDTLTIKKATQTKAEMPGDFLCAFPLCFSCPLKAAAYRPGIPYAAHKQAHPYTSKNSFSGGPAAGKSPDSRAAPEASKPQVRMAYPA